MDDLALRLILIVWFVLILILAAALLFTHHGTRHELIDLKDEQVALRHRAEALSVSLNQLMDARLPQLESSHDNLSARCMSLRAEVDAIKSTPEVQSTLAAQSALEDLGLG